ncbi:MAG: hypothetical protein JNM56_11405 [Planctomycetia bacterium]|nr:hypothetical protein [Planctomycetia bacterium]
MKCKLLIVLALSAAGSAVLANPSQRQPPGCDITTLRQHGEKAQLIVFGSLVKANAGTTVALQVEGVLKGEQLLAGRKSLPMPAAGDIEIDPKKTPRYVVFCDVKKGEIEGSLGIPIENADILKYLSGALALNDHDGAAMLKFFFNWLDHPDPNIASDAFLEFPYADYQDVKKAAQTFPADRIAQWLQDSDTPWWQYRTFSFLLGHCGQPQHAAVIRKVLDDPRLYHSPHLDGVLNGYTLLAPEQGWAFTRAILANPIGRAHNAASGGVGTAVLADLQPEYSWRRRSALVSVKFLHKHWPDLVDRKKLIEGVGRALDQCDADEAIDVLRQLKAVDYLDKVLALMDQPRCNYPIARRAIMGFAVTFQDHPKAAAFIEARRQLDPGWVQHVENLVKEEAKGK